MRSTAYSKLPILLLTVIDNILCLLPEDGEIKT